MGENLLQTDPRFLKPEVQVIVHGFCDNVEQNVVQSRVAQVVVKLEMGT